MPLALIFTILGGLSSVGQFATSLGPIGELKPFTPQWEESCVHWFKSFDTKTGKWTDNKGVQHFCRIKG